MNACFLSLSINRPINNQSIIKNRSSQELPISKTYLFSHAPFVHFRLLKGQIRICLPAPASANLTVCSGACVACNRWPGRQSTAPDPLAAPSHGFHAPFGASWRSLAASPCHVQGLRFALHCQSAACCLYTCAANPCLDERRATKKRGRLPKGEFREEGKGTVG